MTGTVSPTIPTLDSLNATEDPKVRSALITLRDALNAVLTSGNQLDGAQLGLGTVPNSALFTVALAKLGSAASGKIIVANGSDTWAAVTPTGDISVSNVGALAIKDSVVASRNTALTMGQIVDASLNQNITSTTPANLTGLTVSITPAVASKIHVSAHFDCFVDDPTHSIVQGIDGFLNVDASNQATKATMFHNGPNGASGNQMEITVACQWVVNLTAAAHTIKLQAAAVNAVGTETLRVKRAGFTYFLVSQ